MTVPVRGSRPHPATEARSTGPVSRRALAPDLARGLALAGIAVANTVYYLPGGDTLGKPGDASGADRVMNVLTALFADNRGFPMFALLFGYGIGILHRRHVAAGGTSGSWLRFMGRRNLVLLAFGAVHGMLLFPGDILGSYALFGFLLMLLVQAPGWALGLTAALCLPSVVFFGITDGIVRGGVSGSAAEPNLLLAVVARTGEWLATTTVTVLAPAMVAGILLPMLLGLWGARQRVLEEPEQHLRLLHVVTWGGFAISLAGAAPLALRLAGVTGGVLDGAFLGVWGVVHQATGVAGGAAMAAACGLVAVAASRSAAMQGVAASFACLGTLSLSGYIAQSVIAVVLFPASGLGLALTHGAAVVGLISLGGWALTVVLANVVVRTGRRGPLETLHRRLVYGWRPA